MGALVFTRDGQVIAQIPVERAEEPPTGDLQPKDFGYVPPVPAGWTLVEGDQSMSVPSGATNRYYLNCKGPGAAGLRGGAHGLIFVGCDFYGAGCGTWGTGARAAYNIGFYGCRFGGIDAEGTQAPDGIQIKPPVANAERPENWVIQGCSFLDVTRENSPSNHTDGIQFGGVLDMVVRYCYFDNVAVEHILTNGWNGTPENVLIDRNAFGSVPQGVSAPVHVAGAGSWLSTNVQLTNNYGGAGDHVATFTPGMTVNCSETGGRPLSEWPHPGGRDVWQAYLAAGGV